ncbi:replicase [Macrophomina phaseolina tobamo-like virus]|nr:replicase [Macrophomina phaseolina tobamo-like virus]AII21815.1 replicase [Macrophomina phaseolina tobamo-like virus]
MIEQELMIAKCSRHHPVVDVGGNFSYWLRTGRQNVHSCCPLIDARDGKRFTDRMYTARQWLDAAHSAYALAFAERDKRKAKQKVDQAKHFLDYPGDHYCTRRSENCQFESEVVLFGDSLYDIPIQVGGMIMNSHKATKGLGYIIFDVEMLLATEGFIPGMNCHWKREKRTHTVEVGGVPVRTYVQEIIRYTFSDDSSFEYSHDYQNVVRWATQQTIKEGGSVFVIERDYRHGILRLDITRVPTVEVTSTLSFSLWRDTVKGKTAVRIFDYDGIGTTYRGYGIRSRVVMVDTQLVQKVTSYGFRLDTEAKFTPLNMYSYCASVNVRGTINGVEVSVSESEPSEIAYKVCFTLWFYCFLVKYQQGHVMDFMVKRELGNRALRNAGVGKILGWLLFGNSATDYFTDQSWVSKKLDEFRTRMAKGNKEKWEIPEPSVFDAEPLVRIEEFIDDCENEFVPSVGDVGYYQQLIDCYREVLEPSAIKDALTTVYRRIRELDPADAERANLVEVAETLTRRIAIIDPDFFDNMDQSWSVQEDAERLLDTRLPLKGGPVGNVKSLSNLPSLTPSETASQTPSVIQPFKTEDDGTTEQTASVCATLFSDTPKPKVRLPTSSSKGVSGGSTVVRLYDIHSVRVRDFLTTSFPMGFDHVRVSGEDALCGPRTILEVLLQRGIIRKFGRVVSDCIQASNSVREDWFEFADICNVLGSYGFSTIYLQFTSDSDAKVLVHDLETPFVVISHVNGSHWQTIRPGTSFHFDFSPSLPVVMSGNGENFESKSLDEFMDFVGFGEGKKDNYRPASVHTVSDSDSYIDKLVDALGSDSVTSVGSLRKEGASVDEVRGTLPVPTKRRTFKNPCAFIGKGSCVTSLTQPMVEPTPSLVGGREVLGSSEESLSRSMELSMVNHSFIDRVKAYLKSLFSVKTLAVSGIAFGPSTLYLLTKHGVIDTVITAIVKGFGIAVDVGIKGFFAVLSVKFLTFGFPIVAVVTAPYWLPRVEAAVRRHGILVAVPAMSLSGCYFVWDLAKTVLCFPFGYLRELKKYFGKVYMACLDVDRSVISSLSDRPSPVYSDYPSTKTLVGGQLDTSDRFVNGRATVQARVSNLLSEFPVDENGRVTDFVRRITSNGIPTAKPKTLAKVVKAAPITKVQSVQSVAETSKPRLQDLGKVDAERVRNDRLAWYVTYLDYLTKSVDAFTAYCADLYRDYLEKGEVDFYKRGSKRHLRTDGAVIIDAVEPGKFMLPANYKLPVNARLSCVFSPAGKDNGILTGAVLNVQQRTIITEAKSERIFLTMGMFEYLDKLTLDKIQRKSITEIEPRRNFHLVDGVPGCAKSTEIAQIARPGDLVAVASNAAAQELQEKFVKVGKDPAMVRTIGSRLIGRPESGSRLLVDEGLKVHPGELVLLAEIVGAAQILVFGDRNQLGFKPRVAGYILPELPMHWTVEYRTNSYTVCRDAVVALGRLDSKGKGPDCDGKGIYPHGFTTSNKIERSMSYKQIGSVGEVPRIPDAKYITWTQNDKNVLLSEHFKNVNTIDEFQGGRADKVVLVRLSKNLEPGLRFDRGQTTVAITRHREQLIYASVEQAPSLTDNVKVLIDRVNKIDDINVAYGAFSGDLTVSA